MALPDHLTELGLLFEEWSIADLALRMMKLARATDEALKCLSAKVLPRAEEIDAYLNTFGVTPLDEPANRLVSLAECALDAQTELGLRENPEPIFE